MINYFFPLIFIFYFLRNQYFPRVQKENATENGFTMVKITVTNRYNAQHLVYQKHVFIRLTYIWLKKRSEQNFRREQEDLATRTEH